MGHSSTFPCFHRGSRSSSPTLRRTPGASPDQYIRHPHFPTGHRVSLVTDIPVPTISGPLSPTELLSVPSLTFASSFYPRTRTPQSSPRSSYLTQVSDLSSSSGPRPFSCRTHVCDEMGRTDGWVSVVSVLPVCSHRSTSGHSFEWVLALLPELFGR